MHDWVHYLYPEHGYFRGNELNREQRKIAMSCHLPPGVIEKSGSTMERLKRGLSVANAMIVMSPDLVDYYQSFSSDARIEFIPHGIDVDYFRPSESRFSFAAGDNRRRILTVGNMLRDFDVLAKVVNLASERGVNWVFQVVALRDRLDALNEKVSPRARRMLDFRCGISNAELLSLYQHSDLLYLPLLSATANNAVVEAMSCGLPMLLSDFEATRAYADDTAQYIGALDPDEAIAKISSIVDDRDTWKRASERSRKRAVEELSWEVIVDKQRRFLDGG